MSNPHLLRDEAARMATRAWPIYEMLGWQWRGRPVTEPRLALEIREGIQTLIDNPGQEGWSTGGLSLHWEDEGDDRHAVLNVTVDIGSITPGGPASLTPWPNTSPVRTAR